MKTAPLLAALLLTACGTTRQSVEILSEPEGARVLIDGEYVGKTPVIVELATEARWGVPYYTIEALPTQAMVAAGVASGQVQQQSIGGARRERLPGRVFFDMMLVKEGPVEAIYRRD